MAKAKDAHSGEGGGRGRSGAGDVEGASVASGNVGRSDDGDDSAPRRGVVVVMVTGLTVVSMMGQIFKGDRDY